MADNDFSNVFRASALQSADISEPDWVVPEILAPGITLLAAPPKSGKTRLATDCAVSVSTGKKFLGCIDVRQAGVLALFLEDSAWRIKTRLTDMLDGQPFPDNLHITQSWPTIDQGGLTSIEDYLVQHRDIRLVIVDVLGRFRRLKAKGSPYQEDYDAISAIGSLARRRGASFLVVHHTNKLRDTSDLFDKVSGTTGLTGACDTVMLLERGDRVQSSATLDIAGRDVEARQLALSFDPVTGAWSLVGDAGRFSVSEQRRQIMDFLRRQQGNPKRPMEIARALGKNVSTVRVLCMKMLKDGHLVQTAYGLYTVEEGKGVNSVNSVNSTDPASTPNVYGGEQGVNAVSDYLERLFP